eukprot:SM000006S19349  [mRNA]  locus=s6:188989:190097:- [translate_table: standard]
MRSVRPFGVFVELAGFRRHGLVHVSQVSAHEVTRRDDADAAKVEALAAVAAEGDQVWVKVIAIKHDDGGAKLSCSIKYVSQKDGADLDANNVELEQQQARPPWQDRPKVELGAVLNVSCTPCGGHGHLKTECYVQLGAKTYDLLPDEDDAQLPRSAQPASGRVENGAHAKETTSAGLAVPLGVPRGRGMGMVQPAWMKHGVGIGGERPPIGHASEGGDDGDSGGRATARGSKKKHKRRERHAVELPDKVSTVEEALAVIAKLEEEKRRKERKKRRREEEQQQKERRRRERKGRTGAGSDASSSSDSGHDGSKGDRHSKKRSRSDRTA